MFEAGKKYTFQELVDLDLPVNSLIAFDGRYKRVIQGDPDGHPLQHMINHPNAGIEVISLPIGYTQTVETPGWVTDQTLCWVPVWVRQGDYYTKVHRYDGQDLVTLDRKTNTEERFFRKFGVNLPKLPPKWNEEKYGSLEDAREIARALAEFEGDN